MAWKRVLTKKISGYNVNCGIDYDDSSFTTTSVKCRTVIEKTSSIWYDDRFACNGGVFSNWTAKYDGTGSGSWPYTREFNLYKGTTATSFSTGEFYCACTGDSYNWGNYGSSKTYCGNAVISAPSGAIVKVPTFNTPSVSNISDKSASISFSTANANGQNPWDPNVDVSESNFGSVVKSFAAWSGSVSGLEPNKTYYARGNAKNDAGRGYSAVKSFTTTFVDPGAPSGLGISYNTNEPIPTCKFTLSWKAASAGSKAVSGYRIRIYKNSSEQVCVDTDSTGTSYEFNASTYNFQPGDVLQFGIYSYSKDWAGNKHFNGGGTGSAQVWSGSVTVVSDKFIFASVNGGAFNKHKMYISVNGGSFIEVKKEKFKKL